MKLVVVAALIVGCSGSAKPEPTVQPPTTPSQPAEAPQAIQAAGFNDEGVKAMYAGNYVLAAEQFRQAVARAPLPKYFFNLCTAHFQEGKFADAKAACQAVDMNDPTPELSEKARKMSAKIDNEASRQGVAITGEPSPPAATGGQAAIAATVNEQGVKLMFEKKYSEASSKFREAVARVPEAKYFFNLCTSLYQEGKFSEGLTACNAGKKNDPDAKLRSKIDALSKRIQDEASAQGIRL